MAYQVVKTNDGLEIRDENNTVVWGPSQNHSWPPNADMMDTVFEDADISEPTKSVLQLLVGQGDIIDETTNS